MLAKRLEQQTRQGQLYRLTMGRRSWMEGSQLPAGFSERTQDYVYCSRTRPAYIFADPGGKGYIAHLLNPGGATFGYNQASHNLYWQVCHGVNPQREPDLARKARQLGYSLQLPSNQITLARPRDILQR